MILFRGRNEPLCLGRDRADSGFAMCHALLVAFLASVFVFGWAKTERARSNFIERKSSQVYSQIDSSVQETKAAWENRGERNEDG